MINLLSAFFGSVWKCLEHLSEGCLLTLPKGWKGWNSFLVKITHARAKIITFFYILFLYKPFQLFQVFQILEYQRFLGGRVYNKPFRTIPKATKSTLFFV